MSACHIQASAAIEMYFYGELRGTDRDLVERHLAVCPECRRALEELRIIGTVLASRPDVAAPPGEDWSGFMACLNRTVGADPAPSNTHPVSALIGPRRRLAAVLALAALVALVTANALLVVRHRNASLPVEQPSEHATRSAALSDAAAVATSDAALAQLSQQHFERSKLVVLGLATKDPEASSESDWNYERMLATALLDDTRLYRLAVEERGMKALASVMRDLELVLLQASMSEEPDARSLEQLQRLIRRRDLLTKMDVVSTAGL